MPEIVIVGAGITGLSTALFCKKGYRILEKAERPGGLCASVSTGGFIFDYSGHFLHVRSPEVERLIKGRLGSNLACIRRSAWIYTHSTYIPYPFQTNLHALPERIRKSCLKGALNRPHLREKKYQDFYSFSLATFGQGITRYFMKPYNEKLWTVPARRLGADWVAPFVPRPTMAEIEKSAKEKLHKRFGYNASFFYPRTGGSQSVIDALGHGLPVEYGVTCGRVDYRRKTIATSAGETIHYDTLVSTQPLPELLARIDGLPADIAACAQRLDWNSVYCLNLAVTADEKTDGRQWVYFPEKKYPFYRAGVYTNAMPSMAPAGYRSLYVEISARPGKNPVTKSMTASVVRGLREAGLISKKSKVVRALWLPMPYAYVIYDKYRADALAAIMKFLKGQHIYSIGRYGGWEYSFMEKSILDGKATAALLQRR